MRDGYILSVAIPAYGYPKALEKNVSSLLKIKRSDVEIVVVDNDPTGIQIGEFVRSINDDRFHYYRNKNNIGRSANIAKAVEKSAADHVLLVSCDDLVCNDIIDHLIKVINENPDCGIIMGRVKTDRGNYYGYVGEEHVYRRGYDALRVTPRMGILFPFVVNKRYLDFESLYLQEETYMQTRIAYMASGQGDYVGITDVIAYVIDQISYQDDNNKLECYHVGDWNRLKASWSIGECYFSPQSRAEQLKKDIKGIENLPLRHSHLIKLIDSMTKEAMSSALSYVPSCHDPSNVKNGGTVGFLNSNEVLDIFENEMRPFFKEREDKQLYCYVGCLEDKIKNEKIVLSSMKEMIRDIVQEQEVAVFGAPKEKERLNAVLRYMGISTKKDPDGLLALVSEVYDSEREEKILRSGVKKVLFFDWMARYLMIAWIDEHSKEELWGSFARLVEVY